MGTRDKKTGPPQILSGWKDIASHLGMGVRTVQRYERLLGLPAARVLDRREAERPIAGRSRKNNSHRICRLIVREGAEERVDGHVMAAARFPFHEVQDAVRDGHVGIGR